MSARKWPAPVLAFGMVLGPSFACATQEEPAADTPLVPSIPVEGDGGETKNEGGREDSGSSGCSEGGFCFVRVPTQRALVAVSASSADDAWMLAESSDVLLRWNGTKIESVFRYAGPSPVGAVFTGIWAATKDAVWAVATGSDGHMLFVRYAPPLEGGAPSFRLLASAEPAAAGWIWGTPSGDALWIGSTDAVLRVHEEASGVVVEHLDPRAVMAEGTTVTWSGLWGFGERDVYVAGAACDAPPCEEHDRRAVVAHYDGRAWSVVTAFEHGEILSLRGTPSTTATGDKKLWLEAREWTEPSPGEYVPTLESRLVSVAADGTLGEPLLRHPSTARPACSTRVGFAGTPSTGWFSNGMLVCRWNDGAIERAPMALDGIPVVDEIRAIWSGSADDAWIVGSTLPKLELPGGPFAARRTAVTGKGGLP